MSQVNPIVEPMLRIPRFFRTVRAVGAFDASYTDSAVTDGGAGYRMRSAMDLHPRAGKAISRMGVRHARGAVPTEAQARSSTFVDFDEIDACVRGLNTDGVHVFSRRVPDSMVRAMREHALSATATPRGITSEPGPFPRSAPEAGRYDINEDDTMSSPEMQDYVSDPALALAASRYLGQPVIQDQTALWWTTPMRSQDADMNAQLYHQDRDRLSFLKFFVYLTDVEVENGPHMYIRGTHRKTPWSLRSDGRKTDAIVEQAGLGGRVAEMIGPSGTLMAVDTAGLHKGKPPISGDRLVLQVEFATSLFGAHVDYPIFEPSPLSLERYRANPAMLQRWSRSVTSS
jgi:hypothetical protein